MKNNDSQHQRKLTLLTSAILTISLSACTGTSEESSSSLQASSSTPAFSSNSQVASSSSEVVSSSSLDNASSSTAVVESSSSETSTEASSSSSGPVYNVAFDRTGWQLTASNNTADLSLAIDNDESTRWATTAKQTPNQWLAVEFPEALNFNRIILGSEQSPDDYPRGFEVYVSNDGADWGEVVLKGSGFESTTILHFDEVEAKHFRIVQTGSTDRLWWSIHELNVMLSDQPAPSYADCSDMQALMAQQELSCNASGCHSATPSQAAKISLVGSLEDLAIRFNDVPSVNSNCADEKVIDTVNPSNSLLLKLVNPHSGDQCSTKMPIGSNGVSEATYACFANWVEDIAAIDTGIEEPETEPFIALDGFGSINKVKSLLHGGAVSNEDMATNLDANGNLNQEALKNSIRQWMTTPEFDEKMFDFLQLTLQQKNESTDGGYRATLDAINNNLNLGNFLGEEMKKNIEEGFVRTALRFVKEDQDFRQIATTRTWDVTTAVLVAMAYHDYQNRRPFLRHETSPGILRQYAHIQDSDFSDWRRVTFKQGTQSAYFDMNDPNTAANLRAIPDGGELELIAPRVGYFTTISFLQNWISNAGNKFRVTTNQTLLTGLGLTFEGGDTTAHGDLSGLDEEHAGDHSPECYACHRLMDPMAQVFRNYMNIAGNRPMITSGTTPAAFAFHGFKAPLNDIYDLAQAIHDHPNFGKAWVAKLCNWATSTVCDQQSDEFLRIVDVFESGGYKMSDVIVELFSSPLVTYSEYIDGIQPAPAVILNRTNHFCKNMKVRLGQVRMANGWAESNSTDLCNLNTGVQEKVGLLARDEFTRGSPDLIQAVNLDPFITSGYKQICEQSQNLLIAYGAGNEGAHYNKFFSANDVATSIDNITQYILGFPTNHDQYDNVRSSLQKMYDIHSHQTLCSDTGQDIINANENEVVCGLGNTNRSTVLKHVWVAACSAPSAVGLGF